MNRRLAVALSVSLIVLVIAGPGVALASWIGAGAGAGYAGATTLGDGDTPTASVNGRNVTVSWAATSLPGGGGVNRYTVTRYDSSSVAQSIGASCDATVAGLTCTEAAVDPGDWTYTVTPIQGLWVGIEGLESPDVTVDPPSMTFSSSTSISSLPATLSGDIFSYVTGETVEFRLDNPTGTLLGSSIVPDPVPNAGSSAFDVDIPMLTTAGPHIVYAVGSLGSVSRASIVVLPNDTVAPDVTASIIGKTAGGTAGYIRQYGTYYVYAQVSDTGSPASGVATVRANVTNITGGTTAAVLNSGSWTIDGVTYNYRSNSIRADNPLAEGTLSYSITATDAAGNSGTQGGFSVIIDNTSPFATSWSTTNVSGGTTGRAETGDTVSFVFSEPMDANRFIAGWTGSATPVTIRLLNNGGGDRVYVYNAANSATLAFGHVRLNSTAYTSATVNFTNSMMVMSGSTVTITLGTPSGAVGTATAASNTQWRPSTTAWDWASNSMLNTNWNSGGPTLKF